MKKKTFGFALLLLLLVGVFQWVARTPSEKEMPTTSHQHSENEDDHNQSTHQKQRLQELITMIDNHPQSAKLYAERSTIFMMMEQPIQALADIESAVELEPKNPEYLTNRAMIYRSFERYENALSDLNQAIQLAPMLLAAHFNKGVVLFEMEKFPEALIEFTFCIDHAPEMEQAYFNRAFIHEQLGAVDSAQKDITTFLTLSKNEKAIELAKNKVLEWERIDFKTLIKTD